MNILKHSIKKFIYGTLPYYFMKGYKPDSPYLKYYKYIRKHGYSRHLYEFKDEYLSMPVDVRKDENRNLYYVLKEDGKRLYFQRTTPPHKIQKYYRALMIEQDQRSAHHYFNNNKDVTGKVFVDVGCAEGYSSLEIIEESARDFEVVSVPEYVSAGTAFAQFQYDGIDQPVKIIGVKALFPSEVEQP